MEKEKFVKKWNEVYSEIEKLQKQLKDLRKEYINSNKPFPEGTKVRLRCPKHGSQKEIDEVCIIRWYHIDRNDDVVPNLAKVKKDGTPYKKEEVIYPSWRNPTLEKCE